MGMVGNIIAINNKYSSSAFRKIHIYEGKSLKNHRRSSLPSAGRLIPKEEFSTSIVFNFCQRIDLMMFSISIISLFLLMPAIGVIAIRCRSCEGDTCNYNSIIINCDFGVNSCMRIYSTITGRTYKAGCLYPVENCDRTRIISGEQMQCYICNFDNCNNIQSTYRPDPFGPGGGGQWPYLGEDNRFRPNDGGRYGGYGGYYWNGEIERKKWWNSILLIFISLLATAFSLQ